MSNKSCLNCSKKLVGNYCHHCGQAANTSRFTLKGIFTHEVLHGIFHIDHGFKHTLLELLMRPGHSIREYVQGKRVDHFHFFTFIIIVLLVNSIVGFFFPGSAEAYLDFEEGQGFVKQYNTFFNQHLKQFALGIIPVLAALHWLLFYKARYNLAEHMVVTSYLVGIVLLFDALYPLFELLLPWDIENVSLGYFTAELVYTSWFFFQFFSKPKVYSTLSVLLRSVFSAVFSQAVTIVISYVVVKLFYADLVI